jgi:hypothetical protein
MNIEDKDPLSSEDRKIFNFMSENMDMSPREVAKLLDIEFARVLDILARDLKWVTSG